MNRKVLMAEIYERKFANVEMRLFAYLSLCEHIQLHNIKENIVKKFC